ncbi:MAG: seg [Parcubacteria group bacterium]|nr:seg [Parcubacteria group bacterium]
MKKGFTLIEMMTAVSIFLVVMTISMGAIIGVFEANRKSESLKIVMDNLNQSLEAASREIRFGKTYHCETNSVALNINNSFDIPQNCSGGGKLVAFRNTAGELTTYRVKDLVLEKSIDGGPYIMLTAPEIRIDSTGMNFYVTGAEPVSSGDYLQPRVLIKLRGRAGFAGTSARVDFSVQTTVSQRMLDNS